MEREGASSNSDLEDMMRKLPVIELDKSIFNRVSDEPDADEEDRIADEILWDVILGVPQRDWETAKVTEYNRVFLECALKNAAKYKKDDDDYKKKIEEVNCTLSDMEKFDYFKILPRSPYPSRFYWWYSVYRMRNTNPTSVRSKRYTDPGAEEYLESGVLQFFSMKFSGEFSNGKPMSVYGFVAVRDDVDQLRNYLFNRSRENAYEIFPDSANIPLISPARGISTEFDVLIEYSIKVKKNDSDCAEGDVELMDGCFEFIHLDKFYHEVRDVRIYGSLGPVDIHFASLTRAVEACIDVKIKRTGKGCNNLKVVTAFTSRFPNGIVLYDSSISSQGTTVKEDGLPLLIIDSSVVAVELASKLKLLLEFSTEDDPECEFHQDANKREVQGTPMTHELSFKGKKYGSSEEAIVIGGMLEVEAKVTWSTMGVPCFKW